MKRVMTGILLFCMVATLAGADQAAKPATKRPQIEVVFVLDTTGSMSGLIQAAKEKIWAIANTLATAKPAPEIKMGLVGYRDRGDAYVTKRTDLTVDLDAVYGKLMAFQAQGGGDTPESVNQALHEAVTQMQWSRDKDTYRVIFLVGDCPPHMDYQDDVKYPETCKRAAESGIVINTIQCGSHGMTTPIWRDVALKAEGQYFRVEQSGGAILARTPFDDELAKLSRELDETRVYYGDTTVRAEQEKRERVAATICAKAPAPALAQRAVFNSSASGMKNFAGKQELISEVASGCLDVADVEEEQLPEPMKKMSAEERNAFVRAKVEKRKEIQAKIRDLAAKRQAHIEEQVRRSAADKGSLDHGIYKCIQKQAAKKDISYDKGPAY